MFSFRSYSEIKKFGCGLVAELLLALHEALSLSPALKERDCRLSFKFQMPPPTPSVLQWHKDLDLEEILDALCLAAHYSFKQTG